MSSEPSELSLTLRDGELTVTIQEIGEAMSHLPAERVIPMLRHIVEQGEVSRLRQLIDALEIVATTSAFTDFERSRILSEVATKYRFAAWLQRSRKQYSRVALLEYWDFFMKMARHGWHYIPGSINTTGTSGVLWRATGTLAAKMAKSPADYCHLPAILVNNPEQVTKVLHEITDPVAFLEVLVGEAWEDMVTCQSFLAAFCLEDGEPNERDCIASVMICLQT